MYKKAGVSLYVCCDSAAGALRVAIDTPLVPGFRGEFREVATFATHQEWVSSSYFAQVTDQAVIDMVEWFWIDQANDQQITQEGPSIHGGERAFSLAFIVWTKQMLTSGSELTRKSLLLWGTSEPEAKRPKGV